MLFELIVLVSYGCEYWNHDQEFVHSSHLLSLWTSWSHFLLPESTKIWYAEQSMQMLYGWLAN